MSDSAGDPSPSGGAGSVRLPLAIAVAATLLLALCALLAVRLGGVLATASVERRLEVARLTATVQYLDEVLTMSANLAAHSGEDRWRQRYEAHVAPLDQAIAALRAISPSLFDREMGADTDAANRRLVAMETRALELVGRGHHGEAAQVLDSDAYAADKALYAAGNRRAQQALAELVATEQADARRSMAWAVAATLLVTVLASGAWVVLARRSREERVRADLALAQATRAAAEAANRLKTQFVANTSHELRTPLTAILGYAELLADPTYAERHRADACATITRNGEHLLQVINDLLDMSKIEAGGVVIETVPTDPALIVEDVVSLMRVRASSKGLELERSFAGPLPRSVPTDPMRLRQILLNLVGNAIKFTADGGVEVQVAFDQATVPGALRIVVRDHGIGMDAAQIARLFVPFSQAEDSTERRFGGTGLGLAISKRYAQLLGGDIDVRSTPGQGSEFTLRLPVVLPEPVEWWQPDAAGLSQMQQHRALAVARTQELPQLDGLRILLAEDGRDNRRLVVHCLEQAGAEVVAVENGRLAVEHLLAPDQPGVDLVLMDMQMPELDGYRATHRLREHGVRVPIVALTANAMSTDRERCLGAGCDDYLTKPIDRALLLRTCVLWTSERLVAKV
ncbi:MAG: response regulator [Planctomycetes bacterium]|nr:response regulator [Planctomycetota bacterium]